MTTADRWLLPDGIDEVLPPQAQHTEQLRRRLLDTLDHCGYDIVIPPVLEYLESLLTGTGKDLDLRTFKVTDHLSGRMMGLSADTTPQVARIDAHSLAPEGISRLCYCRTVFHTRPATLLASRTPVQIGAELYGEAGVNADVEIISVMLNLLDDAGLTKLHIDLGNVGVFAALAEEAGLNSEQQTELFALLKVKCASDTRAWVAQQLSDTRLVEAFSLLADLQGTPEALASSLRRMRELVPATAHELDHLETVTNHIGARFPNVSITCDLTELRGYDYHTGLVFAAYVPGFGDAVMQGGRYDETGAVFGRARPATGFSGDLKVLARLGQVKSTAKNVISAPQSDDPQLWQKINQLRAQGQRVVMQLNGDAIECDQRLEFSNDQWQLVTA
ncbi:MAG: ATP phosphoribosyltransferase regulatory subunit [Oleibacter sp.]|nr:ATP phosphoribosyltransferase regulatory subunit [Thalassolituus sp.]